MNINSKTIEKISLIQEKNNILDNRLLIFALSFLSEKATVIKTITVNLVYSKKEISKMIELLQKEDILNKKDLNIISRLEKTSVTKKVNSLEESTIEIINHLHIISGKTRHRVTDKKKRLVEQWLRKGYKEEDLIKVNTYFHDKWSNNPSMAEYVRIETLYNTKFEERLEMAEAGLKQIDIYQQDIYDLCEVYIDICNSQIQEPNEDYLKSLKIKTHCKFLPLKVKKQIAFWLKKGYSKENLKTTIIETVISWSNKPDIIPHITLLKITDNKFPERFISANKIIQNKIAKPGVVAGIEWLKNQGESTNTFISNKTIEEIE